MCPQTGCCGESKPILMVTSPDYQMELVECLDQKIKAAVLTKRDKLQLGGVVARTECAIQQDCPNSQHG